MYELNTWNGNMGHPTWIALRLAEAALCNVEVAMCYFSTLIIAVLYISAFCTAHITVVPHQYKVHLKATRYED